MKGVDGKLIIGTELETKQFDAQIKDLQNRVEDLSKTLDSQMDIPIELRLSDEEREGVEAEVERLKNRIASLYKQARVENEKGKISFKEIIKQFKKGEESLKRFALSLFSIQSIYRAASKASSAWLSQDTELANKLQSVWLGLGALISPILETISDWLLKALGYLNVFVKALSGGKIDFIAKANAKALEKQTKAQEKLNKATQEYDFDVIRKQQDTSSVGTTNDAISMGSIDIPKLDERIIKKLEKFAKLLRENKELIEGIGIILGITFGAIKMAQLFQSIGIFLGSASAGTGLMGLTKTLTALTQIGIITVGVNLLYDAITGRNLKEDLKEIYQGIKDLNEIEKNGIATIGDWKEKAKEQNKQFLELYKSGKMTNDQMKDWNKWMEITTNTSIDQFNELEKRKTLWGSISGKNDKIIEQQKEITRILEIVATNYEILSKEEDKSKESQQKYIETLEKAIPLLDQLGYDTSNLKDKLKELTKNKYEVKISAEDKASGIIGTITDKLKKIPSLILRGLGGASRGFAQGGIVTQPTRALIGEAGYPEYVVPERGDYLSRLASLIGQYGSGGGNVTNVYLNGRLIQREISKTQEKINFATNK